MNKSMLVLILSLFLIIPSGWTKESVDLQVITQIKQEGFENSSVEEILFYLTDVHGPRLTNSPNYRAASEWCVEKLTEWGLENARLEAWGAFGKGWEVEKYSLEMVAPQYLNMIAYPKAWTSGTKEPITGTPVLVDIQSEDDFEKYKGTLINAIVMLKPDRDAETHFEADAKRHNEEDLAKLAGAEAPGEQKPWAERVKEWRQRRALLRKINQFFQEEQVAIILEGSQREHGTIRVHSGGSHEMSAEPAVPALVVAIEHFSRAARLLEKGFPVKLAVNIQARFFENDSLGYNVVAEIPGTDKKLKDEVVMLGGHLDSWHAGTGATDDAAGCAVAMEAVRILKKLDLLSRRTIRIALWGGEEQGLLGSRGYVAKHFGDRKTMQLTPEHERFSAYFNLDNGTGKIRGIYLQENDAVRPIFEAYLKPFHDLGATTVAIRNTGGTDHLAFDALGLPGFQFIQDPIDYRARTHHTNMDVYDHALVGDLMQASVIMAAFVYHTAMREDKLPRKPLPKPEPPEQATNGH